LIRNPREASGSKPEEGINQRKQVEQDEKDSRSEIANLKSQFLLAS
jgi:hypothetical protein